MLAEGRAAFGWLLGPSVHTNTRPLFLAHNCKRSPKSVPKSVGNSPMRNLTSVLPLLINHNHCSTNLYKPPISGSRRSVTSTTNLEILSGICWKTQWHASKSRKPNIAIHTSSKRKLPDHCEICDIITHKTKFGHKNAMLTSARDPKVPFCICV